MTRLWALLNWQIAQLRPMREYVFVFPRELWILSWLILGR
jgi:hypothetical protein